MSKGEPGVHTRRWTTSSENCSGNAQPVTVVSLVRCEVLQVLSKCTKDVLFRSPRGNMLIKVLASWPENERIKKEKIAPCRFTPRSDRTTTRLLNFPWVTGCLFVAVYVWERERESTGESHANYFTNTTRVAPVHSAPFSVFEVRRGVTLQIVWAKLSNLSPRFHSARTRLSFSFIMSVSCLLMLRCINESTVILVLLTSHFMLNTKLE